MRSKIINYIKQMYKVDTYNNLPKIVGYNTMHLNLYKPYQVSDCNYFQVEPCASVPVILHILVTALDKIIHNNTDYTPFYSYKFKQKTKDYILAKIKNTQVKNIMDKLMAIGNTGSKTYNNDDFQINAFDTLINMWYNNKETLAKAI